MFKFSARRPATRLATEAKLLYHYMNEDAKWGVGLGPMLLIGALALGWAYQPSQATTTVVVKSCEMAADPVGCVIGVTVPTKVVKTTVVKPAFPLPRPRPSH